jgi:RND family efflux transporter MFP subunit
MNPTGMRSRLALLAGGIALIACGDDAVKAAPPAEIKNAVTEAQLTTVHLTPEAVKRLGIETAPVESASVSPTRVVGGEVTVPPGQSLTVTAPVAGTVLAPDDGSIPRTGTRVTSGQTLMRLVALPADRDMARVQQDAEVAEAQLRQARAEAERVARLYAERLVSAREQEIAQAELVAAEAAYEAASGQADLVRGGTGGSARGLTALAIEAPERGVVRALNVAPGQRVAAGAPLAEIIRLDRLWIRVPVYAGDASRFSRNAEASVHGLAGPQSGPLHRARPVTAAPSADPAAASVDLYYEVLGASQLRPGERVGITIPLSSGSSIGLSVPMTAVVRDMSGGSWVYERSDSTTFVRRRIEIERVVGGRAVLAAGPRPGTPVVTAGAAELFGTEFGAGK